MSAFDRFSVWNQRHKYLTSYLVMCSEQQVSDVIMTSQKPVDLDSGDSSLLDVVASVKY